MACEQAPREGEKTIRPVKRESAREASGTRALLCTPSSPDRSQLIPLTPDCTRLTRPKPKQEPVHRLSKSKNYFVVLNYINISLLSSAVVAFVSLCDLGL